MGILQSLNNGIKCVFETLESGMFRFKQWLTGCYDEPNESKESCDSSDKSSDVIDDSGSSDCDKSSNDIGSGDSKSNHSSHESCCMTKEQELAAQANQEAIDKLLSFLLSGFKHNGCCHTHNHNHQQQEQASSQPIEFVQSSSSEQSYSSATTITVVVTAESSDLVSASD